MTKKEANELRQKYSKYIPVKCATELLGVSSQQLAWLVAGGRQPFDSFGGNIGIRQKYIRIYTEPLFRYLYEGSLDG